MVENKTVMPMRKKKENEPKNTRQKWQEESVSFARYSRFNLEVLNKPNKKKPDGRQLADFLARKCLRA